MPRRQFFSYDYRDAAVRTTLNRNIMIFRIHIDLHTLPISPFRMVTVYSHCTVPGIARTIHSWCSCCCCGGRFDYMVGRRENLRQQCSTYNSVLIASLVYRRLLRYIGPGGKLMAHH